MKISYNWLQSFFDKKLPLPRKTADLLCKYSLEVEEVKRVQNDWILEIDMLPNRAHDCASHIGVAREIAAILGYKLKVSDKEFKTISRKASNEIKIDVKEKDFCKRYTALVIDNIKVGSSPKWIKDRLEACGLNSINNIVDIANYVMLETGQPLHAFDLDKITGKSLIIRKAKKGESITTLDNQSFKLEPDVLIIADKSNPLCIAGIKGGKLAEIDKKTKTIVLEAANFDYLGIRNSSRKMKLMTDASWRFEREPDINLTEPAIKMAATMIGDIAQGDILSGLVDFYPNKIKPKKVITSLEKIRKVIGVKIEVAEIKEILKKLYIETKVLESKIELTIPTWRKDINIEEDAIEEIARLYGLEKIKSKMPEVALSLPQKNDNLIYRNKVQDILAGLGFFETYNRSLVGEQDISLSFSEKAIRIANPLSKEQEYLRTSHVPALLKNVAKNKKSFEEVRLFELAKTFGMPSKDTIEEDTKLAAVISLKEGTKNQFYYLKGSLDLLLNKMGLSDIWYDDAIEDKSRIPKFCHHLQLAQVKVGNDYLGYLAKISENAINQYSIKSDVFAFEVDFGKLIKMAKEEAIYYAPSKYPAIVRDIAVLVERNIRMADVFNVINSVGGNLIQDVDLFDMYEDETSFEGRKSLAFHIIYQSHKRTLTDKEVNKVQQEVIKALELKNWEVRK